MASRRGADDGETSRRPLPTQPFSMHSQLLMKTVSSENLRSAHRLYRTRLHGIVGIGSRIRYRTVLAWGESAYRTHGCGLLLCHTRLNRSRSDGQHIAVVVDRHHPSQDWHTPAALGLFTTPWKCRCVASSHRHPLPLLSVLWRHDGGLGHRLSHQPAAPGPLVGFHRLDRRGICAAGSHLLSGVARYAAQIRPARRNAIRGCCPQKRGAQG